MVPFSDRSGHRVPIKYPLQWFFPKINLFHGNFGNFFHWYLCRNRYAVCVEFENVMKSTQKKKKKTLQELDKKTYFYFRNHKAFFYVGPPKEDIFSGHYLSPVFQIIITHYDYKFPLRPSEGSYDLYSCL